MLYLGINSGDSDDIEEVTDEDGEDEVDEDGIIVRVKTSEDQEEEKCCEEEEECDCNGSVRHWLHTHSAPYQVLQTPQDMVRLNTTLVLILLVQKICSLRLEFCWKPDKNVLASLKVKKLVSLESYNSSNISQNSCKNVIYYVKYRGTSSYKSIWLVPPQIIAEKESDRMVFLPLH